MELTSYHSNPADMDDESSHIVPLSLERQCQDVLIRALARTEPQFHARKINDLCKRLPGHLLEPILASLLDQNHITDVALSMFLVPERLHLNMNGIVQIKNSTFKQIGYSCPNLVRLRLLPRWVVVDDFCMLSIFPLVSLLIGSLSSPPLLRSYAFISHPSLSSPHLLTSPPPNLLTPIPPLPYIPLPFCPTKQISLNLSDCVQLSNSVVRAILQGCPFLSDLNLDRCRRITDAAFDVHQSPFQTLVACLSLESLSMQGCPSVTGQIVDSLNKLCGRLTHLNLSQCKHVERPAVQQIFEHCGLVSLNLSFIDEVSDAVFCEPQNVFTVAEEIRYLHDQSRCDEKGSGGGDGSGLSGVDSGSGLSGGDGGSGLSGVDRGSSGGSGSGGDSSSDSSGSSVSGRLESGDGEWENAIVRSASFSGGDSGTTVSGGDSGTVSSGGDSGSASYPKRNRRSPLRALHLSKSSITDRSIPYMSFLAELTEIHLQWCSGVTDDGVRALVVACPLLTTIDLMSCSITNPAVHAIAKGFHDLKHLDVSWCSGITDAGIQHLAPALWRSTRTSLIAAAFAELPTTAAAAAHRTPADDAIDLVDESPSGDDESFLLGARRLQTLCVVWCSGITNEAITALATLPCLQVVEASGCSGVSSSVVGAMRAHGVRVVL